MVVFDSGYDLTRLAWLLGDLPVEVTRPAAQRPGDVLPRPAARARHQRPPAPARRRVQARRAATWPAPAAATITETDPVRHRTGPRPGDGCTSSWPAAPAGKATTASCPSSRAPSSGCAVDHLPGDRNPEPLWLWSSRAGTSADEVDRAWQAFLRRFDIEHTFRFLKQVLGWTRPETPRPGRRRPVDLARPRLLRPAPPRPPPRRRHPAALAAALPARPPHPRPGPPRVPEHPPGAARSGQRAETRQTRTRTPARIEEPAPGHPPRRGQDRQARRAQEEDPQAEGLNNKLRTCPGTRAVRVIEKISMRRA